MPHCEQAFEKYDFPPGRGGRGAFTPTDAECFACWDALAMLPHIREHSLLVAGLATFLAKRAAQRGLDVDVAMVRASGLLHDIAKTYTIRHGGHHSQLGGAWAMDWTGDARLAQGVVHHVHWPFELDVKRHFLPLAIIYADKRVKHDRVVPLTERFLDLLERYGTTERIRQRIGLSNQQAKDIEASLSRILEIDLHAYPFDSRGLVE
ncbi:MAG: HDIG domain-containing protein [Desulfovibrionaceae bacterium]|nr:HDIG domain-containing protein [Desulfovibrionaceae bacterium]MBF0513473.1 HDIG domain-containing protein [Desulfovibrionaceae bacterium]